jgi:hypothetical protein
MYTWVLQQAKIWFFFLSFFPTNFCTKMHRKISHLHLKTILEWQQIYGEEKCSHAGVRKPTLPPYITLLEWKFNFCMYSATREKQNWRKKQKTIRFIILNYIFSTFRVKAQLFLQFFPLEVSREKERQRYTHLFVIIYFFVNEI